MRVVVFSRIWPGAVGQLEANYDCVTAFDPDPETQRRQLADAQVVIIRSPVRLNEEHFAAARNLKLVVRAGTGLEGVDLKAAAAHGVRVVIVPLSARSVAEHTLALMLAACRRIAYFDRQLRQGRWEKHSGYIRPLDGQTLGLLGLGRIGRETARLAHAFQMSLLAWDRSPEKPEKQQLAAELGLRFLPLDELLAQADIVTIHLPLTGDTRQLLDAQRLARMKRDAVLVNVARGGIVDEQVLAERLAQGKLAAAALDVFATEPPGRHPLLALDNVVATPHVAAQTERAQEEIGERIVKILAAFARGQDIHPHGISVLE